MKALRAWVTGFLLVAVLSYAGPAHTQDGEHRHPALEQTDVVLSAEIDALARELTAEIETVRDETRALAERVGALENLDPPVDPPASEARLQVGPWGPFPYNIEEPYINLIHAGQGRWEGNPELDPATGLPSKLNGTATISSMFFTVSGRDETYMNHWDGDWILDFQTADGKCNATVGLLYFPGDPTNERRECSFTFTRDRAGGVTPYHTAIRILKLRSPLVSLRLYRAENEQAINEGKVYNPKFCDAVRGYDVFRDMDLAEANRNGVRNIDQQATLKSAFWGNLTWESNQNLPAPQYLGKPLLASLAIANECGPDLWHHAPLTLGSPVDIHSAEIYSDNLGQWLDNIVTAVKANRDEIFQSIEWERYADAFLKALETSGYPKDKPIYVTLANEVWNYAGQYNYTSRYAGAIGANERLGYGALMARFAVAFGDRLETADYNITFVIEGQAANSGTTADALKGAKDWLEANGYSWDEYAPYFGVSVASYWGAAPDHLARDGVDPNDLDALEQWFLTGPANSISTLNWNLAQWRAHSNEAAKYGVKFIGAYEGGSHLERVNGMTEAKHQEFVWGERGARVNTALIETLSKEFPGAILSNYVLAGPPGGQPWFEGPLGEDTPMNESWREFAQ